MFQTAQALVRSVPVGVAALSAFGSGKEALGRYGTRVDYNAEQAALNQLSDANYQDCRANGVMIQEGKTWQALSAALVLGYTGLMALRMRNNLAGYGALTAAAVILMSNQARAVSKEMVQREDHKEIFDSVKSWSKLPARIADYAAKAINITFALWSAYQLRSSIPTAALVGVAGVANFAGIGARRFTNKIPAPAQPPADS